jgi:hypothetical protein
LCGQFAPQCAGIHVVHEGPLPVDLDHGEPFPVTSLKRRVPFDIDLLEVEGDLLANLVKHPQRSLAEVAALRTVKNDFPLLDRHGPKLTFRALWCEKRGRAEA